MLHNRVSKFNLSAGFINIVQNIAKRDKRNYYVNFDKINKILQYSPKYTIRDGINELIQEFRQGRFEDWQNSKYSNYKMFKEMFQPFEESW